MKKIIFYIFLLLFIFGFRLPEEKIHIFLVGDSTMADKLPVDATETGWGMPFANFFIPAAEVKNEALNGKSTKSFINQGHWARVMSEVKKGDWVFIQFGHNDQKASDTTRFADAKTTYRQNLIRFVTETRAKGGNPVLITPVMRRKFDENGKFIDLHGDYPKVVREIAKKLQVPLIDLHVKSQAVIEKHGVAGSKILFMHHLGGIYPKFPEGITDDTHFSEYGAAVMASLVADAILELNLSLKNFLKKSEFTEKFQFELPKIHTPAFRKDTFNILRYGAKSDGITVNTQAINQAIDMCHQAGGGTVLIPTGLWLTGPVTLKNNVNLHLTKGALLQFSRNFDDYPIILTTWEGQDAYRCQPPISGKNLENIGITGEGVLDGGGDAWRAIKKEKLTAGQWTKLLKSGGVTNEKADTWYPSEKSRKGNLLPNAGRILNGIKPGQEELLSYKDFLRPNMVSLTGCKNILIDGITFRNSPAWTIHPVLCEHITVRNVQVRNYWYAQNTDAIDLESCRNGLVEGCKFDTGDDGITIKSGRDEQGRARGVPTENIIVRDCEVYHAHGGFVIGSEMSGGVRNMFVSNCTFIGTDVGLRFKTTRGRGGIVENIYVNQINMSEIVGEAIIFDMYYMAKDPVSASGDKDELPVIESKPIDEGTPQFKNFYIRKVNCIGAATGILVRGLPEMNIKNILIEDAMLQSKKGLVCIEGSDITFRNITLLPAEKTIMQVQNSTNITFDNIRYPLNTDLLLKISGNRSQNVKLLNTDKVNAKKDIELGENVSKNVMKQQ